ncbi:MAG: hypothetical protein H7840_03595 [Alphaproteobacteria bacterium]
MTAVLRRLIGRMGRCCSVLVVALGLAVASSSGVSAATQDSSRSCVPGSGKVQINFKSDVGQLRYNHTLTQKQITALAQREGSATRGAKGKIIGLTTVTPKLTIGTYVKAVRLNDGRYCLWLTGVDAMVAYTNMVVYVDRKYAENTCEYRVTLEHEYQHVAFYRSALTRHTPYIRAKLERAVTRFPIIVNDLAKSRSLAMKILQDKLAPEVTAFKEEQNRTNASIDTAESYRRTQARCKNW